MRTSLMLLLVVFLWPLQGEGVFAFGGKAAGTASGGGMTVQLQLENQARARAEAISAPASARGGKKLSAKKAINFRQFNPFCAPANRTARRYDVQIREPTETPARVLDVVAAYSPFGPIDAFNAAELALVARKHKDLLEVVGRGEGDENQNSGSAGVRGSSSSSTEQAGPVVVGGPAPAVAPASTSTGGREREAPTSSARTAPSPPGLPRRRVRVVRILGFAQPAHSGFGDRVGMYISLAALAKTLSTESILYKVVTYWPGGSRNERQGHNFEPEDHDTWPIFRADRFFTLLRQIPDHLFLLRSRGEFLKAWDVLDELKNKGKFLDQEDGGADPSTSCAVHHYGGRTAEERREALRKVVAKPNAKSDVSETDAPGMVAPEVLSSVLDLQEETMITPVRRFLGSTTITTSATCDCEYIVLPLDDFSRNAENEHGMWVQPEVTAHLFKLAFPGLQTESLVKNYYELAKQMRLRKLVDRWEVGPHRHLQGGRREQEKEEDFPGLFRTREAEGRAGRAPSRYIALYLRRGEKAYHSQSREGVLFHNLRQLFASNSVLQDFSWVVIGDTQKVVHKYLAFLRARNVTAVHSRDQLAETTAFDEAGAEVEQDGRVEVDREQESSGAVADRREQIDTYPAGALAAPEKVEEHHPGPLDPDDESLAAFFRRHLLRADTTRGRFRRPPRRDFARMTQLRTAAAPAPRAMHRNITALYLDFALLQGASGIVMHTSRLDGWSSFPTVAGSSSSSTSSRRSSSSPTPILNLYLFGNSYTFFQSSWYTSDEKYKREDVRNSRAVGFTNDLCRYDVYRAVNCNRTVENVYFFGASDEDEKMGIRAWVDAVVDRQG